MMEIAGYPVEKLYEGVYGINEFGFSTMYLIEGTQQALVIDCGVGAGDFKAVVEQLTTLPYRVVATHAHVDHVGGRGQFDRIYLHPDDIPSVKKVTAAYRWAYCLITAQRLIPLKKCQIHPIKREPELVSVREGDCFDLGGRTLEVIHNPGHTLGSISLLDREHRVLFGGDNFNPMLLLCLPHAARVEQYLACAQRVLRMDTFDRIVCSHQIAVSVKESAEATLACARDILKEQMKNRCPRLRIQKGSQCAVLYLTNRIYHKKRGNN